MGGAALSGDHCGTRCLLAIDGVKWLQNGQVENVPFAGRRRVCAKVLGCEENVNSMISRRRCVEEDLTFIPAANQHVRTGDGSYRRIFGRGQVSPLLPLARTKAPGEGLPWVSPSLDQRDKGLEVGKTLLDFFGDVIDDLRHSLVK